jgi:plastocyanin
MTRSPIAPLASMGAALLLVAACSGGVPSAAPTAAAPTGSDGTAQAVAIRDFAFSPASLTVAVGTTVTWTDDDTATHTVTADDGSFDSRNLSSGGTFSRTFTASGTYAYHCAIHSSMKGTIVVP